MPRDVRCRIGVVACGQELQPEVAGLTVGTPVRISGFISRESYRSGESRLILHADAVERIE